MKHLELAIHLGRRFCSKTWTRSWTRCWTRYWSQCCRGAHLVDGTRIQHTMPGVASSSLSRFGPRRGRRADAIATAPTVRNGQTRPRNHPRQKVRCESHRPSEGTTPRQVIGSRQLPTTFSNRNGAPNCMVGPRRFMKSDSDSDLILSWSLPYLCAIYVESDFHEAPRASHTPGAPFPFENVDEELTRCWTRYWSQCCVEALHFGRWDSHLTHDAGVVSVEAYCSTVGAVALTPSRRPRRGPKRLKLDQETTPGIVC